ncbi:UDP-3-O-(3-hydroxymyristoyl)glucosamine N-acyltransferase [Thiohalophilus thiocyanatoxydans]|uniref:UDP-3-O-acylglucosamine N-acyltransferase n=1 Tax=Thiohalophilus thiocyanatoxydans TaxID=381308 RepID=A0A4R8ISG6_9GAMM|nr:UDP-3-O-(3-hydroxymyristoyl)glucosamine N-acyltransferase [Thiohalophilus thiocyanatoxydans]TDY00123.1 UDP-3-O-[3-hydroxymyristoyl] glucosamine N-acyltransferase [Thiohalophilus thiocyanatoxydans]
MKLTLQQLARHAGGRVVGDDDIVIDSVATLNNARPGSITFLTSPSYRQYLGDTRASAVILSESDLEHCPVSALVVDDPYVSYARLANLLYPAERPALGVHPAAVIDKSVHIPDSVSIGPHCYIGPSVKLGENVSLGPGCVLESGVEIGEKCYLHANVTVQRDCVIGKQAVIHPGVIIGSDGFGQANDNGIWIKIPQIGKVVIGDDVEIGANTTIDRGAIDDTIIGDNVKLDNLIQVAHNVRIGAYTVIASSTAIAGSVQIGCHCMIAGAVAIAGHIEIADNVTITGMSLVTHTIREPGVYSSGVPLDLNRQWHKNAVRFKQLDEMAKRIKKLESRLGK